MIAIAAVPLLLAAVPIPPRNSAATSPAGFRIREEVRVERNGTVETGWETLEVDGNHVRRETSNRPGATIVDAIDDAHALVVAGPDGVQVVTRAQIALADVPGPMMDGIGVSPSGEPVASAEPFRATGRTVRIGAWTAREAVSTAPGLSGQRTTLYLADRPAGLPNAAVVSVLERVFSRKGSRWAPWFDGMIALRGFPVRRVQEYDGVRVTITVVSIEPVSFPATEFQAPADAPVVEPRAFDGDAH